MQTGKYMHDRTIQKYGMVMERMVVTDKLLSRTIYAAEIRSSCKHWIRKGRWRSYNTMYWKETERPKRTTALGDIIVKFHSDFYEGIENGTINWKMK